MMNLLKSTGQLTRSLSVRFLFAGGVVLITGAYVVGAWVSDRIEQGVVQNSGISAALYIESLLPNQTRGEGENQPISDDARLALQRAFKDGILQERVVTYNVFSYTGLILDSYKSDRRGVQTKPSASLLQALSGEVASQFQTLQAQSDPPEATIGIPLLEVYVPIRDANTGEVLFVVEFYQRAEQLAEDLIQARSESWTLVARVFSLSGVILFWIVHAGSRLIERQRKQLQSQLVESRSLSVKNNVLRQRVSEAAQRSTAQSEKIMQRIGQDLHDGVAQHLSVASLRLEAAGLGPSKDAEIIKTSLDNAMRELRGISRGLALPDLAKHDLAECASRAVHEHNKGFGSGAQFVDVTSGKVRANSAIKICVYRFLQEALSNAARHANAQSISAKLNLVGNLIEVVVSDDGCGFVPDETAGLRDDGGQGLIGLSDRAATLGGTFLITSIAGEGTHACLRLPVLEE